MREREREGDATHIHTETNDAQNSVQAVCMGIALNSPNSLSLPLVVYPTSGSVKITYSAYSHSE